MQVSKKRRPAPDFVTLAAADHILVCPFFGPERGEPFEPVRQTLSTRGEKSAKRGYETGRRHVLRGKGG